MSAALCTSCGEGFVSDRAFDKHRVGVHDYTFPEGAAFDPPKLDGRRCLHTFEMEAAGWARDRWGRWRLPVALQPHLLERVEL